MILLAKEHDSLSQGDQSFSQGDQSFSQGDQSFRPGRAVIEAWESSHRAGEAWPALIRIAESAGLAEKPSPIVQSFPKKCHSAHSVDVHDAWCAWSGARCMVHG